LHKESQSLSKMQGNFGAYISSQISGNKLAWLMNLGILAVLQLFPPTDRKAMVSCAITACNYFGTGLSPDTKIIACNNFRECFHVHFLHAIIL